MESDSVNGTVGPIHIVFNYLKYTCAAKAFQYFGCIVALTALSKMECMSKKLPHRNRKGQEISFTASNPNQGSFRLAYHLIIPEKE